MENQLISVVVPAYNCAELVSQCIDSLLSQTVSNLEIIVVNDGSRDETARVLQAYGDRIRVITQENQGVTAARLNGVRHARGQWIGFADADDQMEPWMYERLLQNALQEKADISHCGCREVYSDGRILRNHNTGTFRLQDRLTGLKDLIQNIVIEPSLWDKLYRKSLFEGLDEKMDRSIRNNEDMLMNFYLFSEAQRSVYQDVDPYHYCIQAQSASRGKLNPHVLYDPIAVRERILGECEQALQSDAREALVWMTLFSYRQVMDPRTPYEEDRKRLREMLREQKQYLPSLRKKTALQLQLVCSCPWLYRLFCRLLRG